MFNLKTYSLTHFLIFLALSPRQLARGVVLLNRVDQLFVLLFELLFNHLPLVVNVGLFYQIESHDSCPRLVVRQ